ncbi:MAG TPA: hypothetical protein VD999_01010 [Vitreimonas sp.]|nr:hypothetical protein [Vitreimonas sp.]
MINPEDLRSNSGGVQHTTFDLNKQVPIDLEPSADNLLRKILKAFKAARNAAVTRKNSAQEILTKLPTPKISRRQFLAMVGAASAGAVMTEHTDEIIKKGREVLGFPSLDGIISELAEKLETHFVGYKAVDIHTTWIEDKYTHEGVVARQISTSVHHEPLPPYRLPNSYVKVDILKQDAPLTLQIGNPAKPSTRGHYTLEASYTELDELSSAQETLLLMSLTQSDDFLSANSEKDKKIQLVLQRLALNPIDLGFDLLIDEKSEFTLDSNKQGKDLLPAKWHHTEEIVIDRDASNTSAYLPHQQLSLEIFVYDEGYVSFSIKMRAPNEVFYELTGSFDPSSTLTEYYLDEVLCSRQAKAIAVSDVTRLFDQDIQTIIDNRIGDKLREVISQQEALFTLLHLYCQQTGQEANEQKLKAKFAARLPVLPEKKLSEAVKEALEKDVTPAPLPYYKPDKLA